MQLMLIFIYSQRAFHSESTYMFYHDLFRQELERRLKTEEI
jgi:hypothetical protein